MKRSSITIRLLLALAAAALCAAPAAAASAFSEGAEAELGEHAEALIRETAGVYGSDLPEDQPGVIDWDAAVRVYVGADVFDLETAETEAVRAALEDGGWIWLLPVRFGEDTVLINVQKGLPLREDAAELFTEAERREVEANVGKWIGSVWTHYPPGQSPTDYDALLRSMLGRVPEGTMLAGGQPFFVQPVALIPGDDGTIESLAMFFTPQGDPEDIAPAETAPGVYDYGAVRALVGRMVPPAPDVDGGGWELPEDGASPWPWLALGGSLALLPVGVPLAVQKLRKR